MDMSLGETSRRRAHDSIAHSDSGKERRRAHSRVSQAHRAVTDSVGLCSIFNSTNRIEPVFLAPFRLYCKLVRRPGQGCSSAPWAPCRMQHSYRSFTVHHGVWFWDSTRMQRRRAHCSVGSSTFTWLSGGRHDDLFHILQRPSHIFQ